MVSRRELVKRVGMAAVASAVPRDLRALAAADYSLEIAPYSFEVSPHRFLKTIAYNQQVPGPLLRLKEGREVTIDVTNRTGDAEMVHWHGLFTPADMDGAMEEGTPHVPAGGSRRYTFTPRPAGVRWYHTHTFAGHDLRKAEYTGQHGFLMVDARMDAGGFDGEFFLALHDWNGSLSGNEDGSMDPVYEVSTINGRTLGFGEPLRVKEGQRVLMHLLNASATDVHWIALAGHKMQVVALDGNRVPQPKTVGMVRLAPAERVSVMVEMDNPGVWVMGEVRKHGMAAGMGIVVEYAGRAGKPQWQQPEALVWDYLQFGEAAVAGEREAAVVEIPLVFESKFVGHGAMDKWMINGKSFPDTATVSLTRGQRYRLLFKNSSNDNHPVHLHRHTFELRRFSDRPATRGIFKDTVLVEARKEVDVEFVADNPGPTLFHCHQQNHMDQGFMMLFRYV